MLGNLINRHDAVRLYRKLRHGHLQQIADKVGTPGPQRVMTFWPAPGHGAAQLHRDDIPAVRQGLAAEEQALSRLDHDFTYAVCSALAAPVPAARAERRRCPARPGYDVT